MGPTHNEANKMQKNPKPGDLFDRGAKHDFQLVTLKAHRKHQYITILDGLAIDYPHLTGGGTAYNGETGRRVRLWKVQGT